MPLAAMPPGLRRSGITTLNRLGEPLHRREIVIDIVDLPAGNGLEPRGRLWGKWRQCPPVGTHRAPAKRTTSRFLVVSQSPSPTELSYKAKEKPEFT